MSSVASRTWSISLVAGVGFRCVSELLIEPGDSSSAPKQFNFVSQEIRRMSTHPIVNVRLDSEDKADDEQTVRYNRHGEAPAEGDGGRIP